MIVRSAHEELRRWRAQWNRAGSHITEDGGIMEYDSRAQFYYAYSSLVLYSFGLENALERAKMDISFFLTNVFEAASVSNGTGPLLTTACLRSCQNLPQEGLPTLLAGHELCDVQLCCELALGAP